MAFHINSSAASAAASNHAADGAAQGTVAHTSRWTSPSSIVRSMLARYVKFNTDILSYSMRTFSAPSSVTSASALDHQAYMDAIFANVRHQISGKENECRASLDRINELLSQAAQKGIPTAVPQTASSAEHAETPGAAPEHHEPARQQATNHHAAHMRRTHEQSGRDNALSLLGGHATPGSHGDYGSHATPPGPDYSTVLADIQEQLHLLRPGSGNPTTTGQTVPPNPEREHE